MVRISTTKFALLCFTVFGITAMHILFSCDNQDSQNVKSVHQQHEVKKENQVVKESKEPDNTWQAQKLAVIVPFRDRFEELMVFIPWIHKFLNAQKIPHKLVVVNQVDMHRFNRASLINIGYLMSKDECDYLVMHDVDLLPNNPDLLYRYHPDGPYHLASPEYHPMYHYKTYIGGVLMMTNEHFKLCRGMSNIFWGWGREDDELFLRYKDNQLKLYRPTGLTTGYDTFKHIHNKERRPRDYNRYGDQKKVQFKRDVETGFDTVQYSLESKRTISIDEAQVTIYNVELQCDKDKTPWCDHGKRS
uniref:Beta-1,4-galactosyltransferase n=1 Tax=Phallusia mammillata TaxID=59560 RepID=A0A6F9D7K1_9ASCI|nr:beta-1,4-galactosyltransferase 7 [Phallusia mammillata]